MHLQSKLKKINPWWIVNIFLLLPSMLYIYLLMPKINLKNVSTYNLWSQKNGSLNFTGYINSKKVFIKISFFYSNLANEKLAYQFLNGIKKNFLIPKVIYINNNIFISEFIENSKNLIDLLNENPDMKVILPSFIKEVLRIFSSNQFVHNDFLLRNILYYDSNFYIIDFYFSSFKGSQKKYTFNPKKIGYGYFGDKNCDEKTIFHDLRINNFYIT